MLVNRLSDNVFDVGRRNTGERPDCDDRHRRTVVRSMIDRVPDRGPAGPLIVELLLDRIGAHNRQRAFAEWNLIKTRSADYASKSFHFSSICHLPQAIDLACGV